MELCHCIGVEMRYRSSTSSKGKSFYTAIACLGCGERFLAKKKAEWSDQVKCPSCGKVFPVNGQGLPETPMGGFLGVKKNPTAFGYDDKGRLVAVDEKGKRFDPKETRYNIDRDPHGWKTSGKKVREKDNHGRPNI